LRQNAQSLSASNKLFDFNNMNKEFLPKRSSQKKTPKEFLQKNPRKIQKILQKNPRKIQKILQKNPEKFPKNSKQFLKEFLILKISNSLHRTWRPKTLSGLFLLLLNPVFMFFALQHKRNVVAIVYFHTNYKTSVIFKYNFYPTN
jgi:predicted PurR-regulated permease PerM